MTPPGQEGSSRTKSGSPSPGYDSRPEFRIAPHFDQDLAASRLRISITRNSSARLRLSIAKWNDQPRKSCSPPRLAARFSPKSGARFIRLGASSLLSHRRAGGEAPRAGDARNLPRSERFFRRSLTDQLQPRRYETSASDRSASRLSMSLKTSSHRLSQEGCTKSSRSITIFL